jgi:uncharacterized protein (TIGR02996 family)
MSDRDALLAAIRAQPDEDTPRLVFADWLDEHDDPDRAAFIRAQVELDRTEPWEPFAVRVRWRQPELGSGHFFRNALPRVDGNNVEWPRSAFRRGFAWALNVRTASLWRELAEPIVDREPIGLFRFWSGTLDDWRQVAASECVKHFRELVFNLNPNEALLALRDKSTACGITDLAFMRASSAGMPEVLEDLFQSPLGRGIRGLFFHIGYESRKELIDAIHLAGPLKRLGCSSMGIDRDYLRPLLAGPATAELEVLQFLNESIGDSGMSLLAETVPTTLRDLTLSSVQMRTAGMGRLAGCDRLPNLRRLNLRGNQLEPRAMKALSQSHALACLRSIDLTNCDIGYKGVRHLTRARFWPNLVEVNLRNTAIPSRGVRHLLDAPIPSDLTALVLENTLDTDSRAALAKKYGDAVVFAAGEVPA